MNENQFSVMLEHVLDRINAIAEGQKNLEEKFTGLEGKFTGLERKMDIRFDAVEKRLDRLESSVTEIKRYMAAVDDNLYDHEQRISILEKKAAMTG